MKEWQDAVSSALIGTQRSSPSIQPSRESLARLLEHGDERSPEVKLLDAAAVLTMCRLAGFIPPLAPPHEPDICDPEEITCCGHRAGHHLALMLAGYNEDVLPEWLEEIASARLLAPPVCLPDLLTLGRIQMHLRPLILPVLGNRGRWLAALNPDWSYATQEESSDLTTWETGIREARHLVIQRLRQDRPEFARELLSSTWDQEQLSDRVDFLKAFRAGLSVQDETFLETRLDDSRKEVRVVAADLLARLPDSRLCKRMIDRVKPLLTITTGSRLSRKQRINVALPETRDKSMVRDGIEVKPPRSGEIEKMGDRAWWLAQIVGAIPPRHWCDTWNLDPATLVKLASENEWKNAIIEGWAMATRRHGDVDWAMTLSLVDVLPPPRQEEVILNLLRRDDLSNKHEVIWMLMQCRHRWSEGFSRVVLKTISQVMVKGDASLEYQLRSCMKNIALCISTSIMEEASVAFSNVTSAHSDWSYATESFLSVLQFRHEMLRETRTESRSRQQ